MKANDYRGKRFGHLVALERVESSPQGRAVWKCQCDCGNTTYVRSGNLQSGAVKSCGRKCPLHKRFSTHKMTHTRLYQEWTGIKSRCVYSGSNKYKYYGARGISMCKEWEESFSTFAKWAMENGYADNLTIERRDYEGDYCPENCTWIPKSEQSRNTHNNLLLTYKGKTQILDDWCKELNLDYKRTHNRLKKLGWSVERAFTESVNVKKRNIATREKYGGDEIE